MRIPLKRLQPRQPPVPQPVLRQHTPHSLTEHLAAPMAIHQLVHGQRLETAGPGGVPVVRLLPVLAARDVQGRAVGNDDVVAAVGGWVEDGLVLAHEDHGDARG